MLGLRVFTEQIMPTVSHSVTIRRPVQDVFAFVTDVRNNPRWQSNLVEARQLTQGPLRAGSGFREVRRLLGRQVHVTTQVTDYGPPARFAIRSTSGPVPFQGRFAFEDADGSTRVTFTLEVQAVGPMKLAEGMVRGALQRDTEAALGRLKAILEAQS